MNQQGDDGRWLLGWSFGDNEALRKLQIKYEMYYALIRLQEIDDPAHAPRQNALRKYYNFKNGKEFSRLNKFIQI